VYSKLDMSKLPDYKEKQKVLYIDATPAKTLISFGERYLKEDRVSDAIEFFQKAAYREGLEKILATAVENGDVMDFQQILKALGRDATHAEWEHMGQRALALQKYTFALQAFEESKNEKEIERVKKMISAEGIDRES
jgi:DNA-directed RNA polymerase beta' subunit